MKIASLFFAVCFLMFVAPLAVAQDWEKGPYEQQLRAYSEYHGEVKTKMEEENERKRIATEKLKITGMQLKAEESHLQLDIETKENSIEKLKAINEKLQATQSVMHDQYVEMEKLFKEQKAENDRLTKELEASKTTFYVKMIEFYQQEDAILQKQIAEMQVRQKDIQQKIAEMQAALGTDQ